MERMTKLMQLWVDTLQFMKIDNYTRTGDLVLGFTFYRSAQ